MLQSRGIAVRKLSCEDDISTYCAALHESAGVYRESSIKKNNHYTLLAEGESWTIRG